MTTPLPAELQPLAHLIATVHQLEARVQELEAANEELKAIRGVQGLIRLRDLPEWYRFATQSPKPPFTRAQLNNWRSRPKHFKVDWIAEVDGPPMVDPKRFAAWVLREPHLTRVKPPQEPAPKPKRAKKKKKRPAIGAAGRVRIVELRRAGKSPEQVAKMTGASVGYVNDLTRGMEVGS